MKIKKPTDLRENLHETPEQNIKGEPFLIQHETGNSVLQNDRDDFDLLEEIEALKAINRGLQDYMDGKTVTHAEMKAHLQKPTSARDEQK